MRETRAIPTTQIKAEEEKVALAKKALQSLQSFPRGMECIDPLRLGIVDNRTLRMISEQSSSSPSVGDLDPKTRAIGCFWIQVWALTLSTVGTFVLLQYPLRHFVGGNPLVMRASLENIFRAGHALALCFDWICFKTKLPKLFLRASYEKHFLGHATQKDRKTARSKKTLLEPDRLNYFSEKFDSKLFLSRIHQDTTSADLEAGAVSLKTDLKGRMQQKKQLVKENFDCFVSCKTTIDDIESKLRRIEEDPEGSGTKHLYDCMQGVNSNATRAFESLFERQAQAEKIRSVQGMLQRFRTLFNLPSTIRESISKGEYDLAVREYRKANSIVLPSHVGILKRVIGEVEKVMQEFKGMLYKSMEDPNIDLTNLENIVRLLSELEPESDPVWHYLNIQNHRIRGLLEKCALDHEARMENLQNELRARALYDAKWRQIQQDLSHSSDIDCSATFGNTNLPGDLEPLEMTGERSDAFRGKYIRRLTAVVIHHVPAFWKVAVSVFSGKFAKASQVSSDSNVNVSAKRSEEKVGDGKYSSHSLDEVAGMLQSTLSAYGSEVQNTFRDFEESNILCPFMSNAIKEISKACHTFEAKESAPPVSVTALRTIQSEVTKIYILRLCSWMRTTTEKITKDETWIPVSILERNRSPYTISSLPLAFRSIITFAMDQINTMIQSLKNEAMKSEDIFLQLQEIQESVRVAFLNCLLNFAGQLGHIGNQLLNEHDRESLHFQNGHAEPEEKSLDPLPGSIVDPHRQLLMVKKVNHQTPRFNIEYYGWLKTRMHNFIMAEDSELWDIIVDDPLIPTRVVKVGDVTSQVPKTKKEYDDDDTKKIEKNDKAKKILVCGIGPDEYNRIFSCQSAKEIWDLSSNSP
ncbi:Exocyst complex component SEC5B [Capsicum annuum]|nr:Exocyst complex component SEC5B [Capsicum annuum]